MEPGLEEKILSYCICVTRDKEMGLESPNGVNTKPGDGMREIKVTVKLQLAILPGGGTVTRTRGLASLGLILSFVNGAELYR